MNRRFLLAVSSVMVAVFAGCSPSESTDETGGTTTDTGDDMLDARVPVPEADPAYVDLVSPELEVPSGEERMFCVHLEIDEEVVMKNLETYQGKYGHHITLLTPNEPQPPGTVEDCTERATMSKYGPFALPDTPLSDGYALLVPAGSKIVMQMHYVNAGPKPMVFRDVARLQKVEKASVSTWVHILATADNDLALPPQQKSQVVHDCEVPAGAEILVLGGHMHERGTRFESLIGKDEASLASTYLVDPWVAEFRDAPPVALFFENPMLVAEKSILRTVCDFNNESPDELAFPEEMCATFGYVAGTDAPIACGTELP
jgi:hypothetical protein